MIYMHVSKYGFTVLGKTLTEFFSDKNVLQMASTNIVFVSTTNKAENMHKVKLKELTEIYLKIIDRIVQSNMHSLDINEYVIKINNKAQNPVGICHYFTQYNKKYGFSTSSADVNVINRCIWNDKTKERLVVL